MKKTVLKAAGLIIGGSKTIPIAACVNITNEGCIVTDLDNYLVFPNTGGFTPGVIDFKQFARVITEFPIMSSQILNDKYCMTASNNKKFTMTSVPASDFPNLPGNMKPSHIVSLTSQDVENMNNLLAFVSNDVTQPSMTGVCLSNGEIAATDAHSLKWGSTAPFEGEFIIIPSAVKVLSTIGGAWEMYLLDGGVYALFIQGDLILISRMIDEKFPNYRAVIPDPDGYTEIIVPVAEFMAEIGRAEYQNKTTRQVVMDIKYGVLSLAMADVDLEREYTATITSIIKSEDSYSIRIGFNAKLMENVIKSFPDELYCSLKIRDANKAIIVNGNSLLMPAMITE